MSLKINSALSTFIIDCYAYHSSQYQSDSSNYEYGISVDEWAASPHHDSEGFVQRYWEDASLERRAEIVEACMASLEREISSAQKNLKELIKESDELSDLIVLGSDD